MAEDIKQDKEIMELLEKLKSMGSREETEAMSDEGPATKPVAAKKVETEKKPKAAPKPKKGSLYAKVLEIESDIKSKEELIDEDFKKLGELLKSLEERENELTSGEKEVKEKESVLNAKLEEIRKIKEELKKIIS